ncbi:MAG: CoA ester lyase [Anaerolineae bacterium]|nr:CoA ester lyase [Anaerolineae bacterium]
MKVRRALLFVPGDDRHKIEKAAKLGADSVIMDLEDGVAFSHKEMGREVVAGALREVDFGHSERLIRINPVSRGGLFTEDILQTVAAQPDGYVLPKVESAEQIQEVAQVLTEAEYDYPGSEIILLAIIETARGVVNLREIVLNSGPRLRGLIFGAEDLVGDLGAVRTPDGWEVFYARSAVVTHASALGLQAIDTVYVHYENIDGLVAEAEQARYMGFTGKLAIHPGQVKPIQDVFTPDEEEIGRAKRLINAYQTAQSEDMGVFVMDGKMVDMPMVRAAEQVLARARAAGITVE